jgi:hypothetical protein
MINFGSEGKPASRSDSSRPAVSSATVGDEVPLVDPERDLLSIPGTPGRMLAMAERVQQAHQEVRARIRADRLMSPGAPPDGTNGELFRTVPGVAMLHPLAEPELRRRVRNAVECLERLVQRYPYDPELQEFLDVPLVFQRWILREPEPERLRVDFCRPDLLGDTLGTVRILEFNASGPGGVISAGMVNRYWRQSSLGGLLTEWGVSDAPFERPDWFADWLIDYGRGHGVAEEDRRNVGLFHNRKSTGYEMGQISGQLRRRGCTPVALEPADFDSANELRLGYLKYLPRNPQKVERWETFCAWLTKRQLLVPNPLAARWVAENKLCLAALSDRRFRYLFTPRQREALDALVPLSRKLRDGVSMADAVTERERFVLKAPYGRRGESVIVGGETPLETWKKLVRDPKHRGWLVQERIAMPVIEGADGRYFRDLVVPVLNGRIIGYISRMGQGHLLNVACGGGTTTVFAPHDLEESDTFGGGFAASTAVSGLRNNP